MSSQQAQCYQCENCKYVFKEARQLENHLNVYDEALQDVAVAVGKVLAHYPLTHEIVCPFNGQKCRNARFARFQDFASHYNTHLECKDRECPGCHNKFVRCSQIMAHGCDQTRKDPALLGKLDVLKTWAIERNLYESKQAQIKLREECLVSGTKYLSSPVALRLLTKALLPRVSTVLRNHLEGALKDQLDVVVDDLLVTAQERLQEASLDVAKEIKLEHEDEVKSETEDEDVSETEDEFELKSADDIKSEPEEDVKIVQGFQLDHRKGTPHYGYVDDGSIMEESGFGACRLIAKPPSPEPPRQLPPRRPLPNYANHANLAAKAAAYGIQYNPTSRPPKRRVVRGKPRPGVKGPRPRINGPPRLRDKAKVHFKVENREQTTESFASDYSHTEVDENMTCDEEDVPMQSTFKQEEPGPLENRLVFIPDSGPQSGRGAGTQHFPAAFGADQNEETKQYIKTDLQIYHASIPVPDLSSLGINLWTRQGARGGQGADGGVSAPPASPETIFPTPESIVSRSGTPQGRVRVINPNYGGAIPFAHFGEHAMSQREDSYEKTDEFIRAASGQGTGSYDNNIRYQLDPAQNPTVARQAQTGSVRPSTYVEDYIHSAALRLDAFLDSWSDSRTYSGLPSHEMTTTQTGPHYPHPRLSEFNPAALAGTAPEAFPGATTMSAVVHPSGNQPVSSPFENGSSAYMAPDRNASISFPNSNNSNFPPATTSAPPNNWAYAPLDAKNCFEYR